MKKLYITISGEAMTGKSTLTYLIKEFLREKGFEVEFTGNPDHPTEKSFDKIIRRKMDERVDDLKERKIIIKEEQLKRNFDDSKWINWGSFLKEEE